MNNKLIVFILIVAASFLSCKKDLERVPVGTVDIDAFYKTSSDAETALLGCYNRVFGSDFNTNLLIFNDVSSDDERGYLFGSPYDTRIEITKFNNPAENIWSVGYNAIANINLLLEKVALLPDNIFLRPGRKQQIIAEGKFLRAYTYWHLLHIFGGVPLVLQFPKSTGIRENAIPRNTKAEVYAQILLDLQDAERDLPSNYNVATALAADNLRNTKGRATTWAAKMLQARLFLDLKDYTNAAAKTQEVSSSTIFQLSNDLARDNNYRRIFFGEQNTEESILEVQNIQNEIDQGGFVFLHLGAFPPPFGVTEDLYFLGYDTTNGNGPRDIRRAGNIGPAGGPYYAVKYTKFFGDADPDNYIIFRYAEALMINAEAQNELQGPNNTSLNYVNLIRARARGVLFNVTYSGLPPIILPSTKEAFRQIIRDEKRREFALEGIRWYDLLRYGSNVAMAAVRRSTGNNLNDTTKLILPIPLREEQVSMLTQNPGY